MLARTARGCIGSGSVARVIAAVADELCTGVLPVPMSLVAIVGGDLGFTARQWARCTGRGWSR